jgi:hypothetical protein
MGGNEMLEFGSKVAGYVNVPLEFTENDICNIIVSSFEGGSNYWMGVDNTTEGWKDKPKDEPISTWATKLLLDGKKITLYDIEDEETIFSLTLVKLLKGIMINATKRPFAWDRENWDALDCDCIMQYALFGDTIYG